MATLHEYLATRPRGELTRIHRATGVAYSWLYRCAVGEHAFSRYSIAKKISDATGGAVSVDELCTLPKRKPRRRKRVAPDDRLPYAGKGAGQ